MILPISCLSCSVVPHRLFFRASYVTWKYKKHRERGRTSRGVRVVVVQGTRYVILTATTTTTTTAAAAAAAAAVRYGILHTYPSEVMGV